jgi:uncharacterized membrane protein YcaP (DUF421 family)
MGKTFPGEALRRVTVAFIRTIVLYALVIVAMRVMGKRQIGELEPSELAVTILMSELAAIPMQDLGTPLLFGIVPILTLLGLSVFMSTAGLKSLRFRALMCGKPSLLMENGRILQKELRRNRLTTDELIEALRGQNITDLATVQYAILETKGTLSAILYPEFQPATKKDVNVQETSKGLPIILVNDGRLLDHNRQILGLPRSWLDNALKQQGIAAVKDVFLLVVDAGGRVYCLAKEGTP